MINYYVLVFVFKHKAPNVYSIGNMTPSTMLEAYTFLTSPFVHLPENKDAESYTIVRLNAAE